MILAHSDFENTFSIEPGKVNVLVVEPEDCFFAYCRELNDQTSGGIGRFCLSEGETEHSLSKSAIFISDYLSLQINDKKAAAKFYRSLQEITERHFLREYQQICALLADFFGKLNTESDYPLEYDGDDCLCDLFKALGVRIAEEETFLQNILLYLRTACLFFKTKCFFFMNLKTVLTESELLALYHEAELNEICIFLLENSQKSKQRGEIVTIIDRDLCEIIA